MVLGEHGTPATEFAGASHPDAVFFAVAGSATSTPPAISAFIQLRGYSVRKLPLNRSLLFYLDQLEYSEAGLSADPAAEALAAPFREEIEEWMSTFNKQRAARRDVVRGNAVVNVRNEQLDNLTTGFGVTLVAEVRGDRSSTTFRRFFPVAPSELIRRSLRKQCQNTQAAIVPTIRKMGESSALFRFADLLDNAATAALDALDARAQARGTAANAMLDVEEWKEGVNRLRMSTYGALLGIAAEKNYPRSWAESFFAGTHRAGTDDEEDPLEPGPSPSEPEPIVTPRPEGVHRLTPRPDMPLAIT